MAPATRELERMALALEHAPVGILMVDRRGTITLANRHAEALFAFAPGTLTVHSLDELVPAGLRDVHARHRAAYFERPIARAMGAGRELFGQRSDGTAFPLEIGLSPVPTLAGTMMMAVVVDITERRLATEAAERHARELERVNAHLKRSNQDLEDFASIVSHDLKAPLRAIRLMVELLIEDHGPRLGDAVTEELDEIAGRAERLQTLIEGLLTWTRAGQLAPDAAPIEVAPIIDSVLANLRLPEGARVVVPGGLPSVRADPLMLGRVFHNLIDNALTHSDHPTTTTVTIDGGREADRVYFRVTDDGPGIPARQHARAFRMFQSLRRGHAGDGVGLALVRRIVARWGGRLLDRAGPRPRRDADLHDPGRRVST